MQNSPQFEVGDLRRTKDCQDRVDQLIAEVVDVMVTNGWDSLEVLEAAEVSLKKRWRSIEADPDPADEVSELSTKPIGDHHPAK
jgi:hypothetical protein